MILAHSRPTRGARGYHPGPPPERWANQQTIDYSTISESVNREFSCDHEDVELRVKVSVRGARTYWNQCRRCGSRESNVKASDLSGVARDAAPDFEDSLQSRWFQAKMDRHRELDTRARASLAQIQAEMDAAWDRWYGLYLDSDAWKSRRAAVLQRDRGLCQGCLVKPATQIHHLSYKNVGYELLFELTSVCDECHRKIHPDKS